MNVAKENIRGLRDADNRNLISLGNDLCAGTAGTESCSTMEKPLCMHIARSKTCEEGREGFPEEGTQKELCFSHFPEETWVHEM